MRKACGIISIIILVILIFVCFKGNPLAIIRAEKDTMAYLEQQGYTEENIELLRGEFDASAKHPYSVRVVFKEDAEVEYLFVYDEEENIYKQGEK